MISVIKGLLLQNPTNNETYVTLGGNGAIVKLEDANGKTQIKNAAEVSQWKILASGLI